MNLVGFRLGQYKIINFIKGGGMGEVYLAEDPPNSRQVAIKIMKSSDRLSHRNNLAINVDKGKYANRTASIVMVK